MASKNLNKAIISHVYSKNAKIINLKSNYGVKNNQWKDVKSTNNILVKLTVQFKSHFIVSPHVASTYIGITRGEQREVKTTLLQTPYLLRGKKIKNKEKNKTNTKYFFWM